MKNFFFRVRVYASDGELILDMHDVATLSGEIEVVFESLTKGPRVEITVEE